MTPRDNPDLTAVKATIHKSSDFTTLLGGRMFPSEVEKALRRQAGLASGAQRLGGVDVQWPTTSKTPQIDDVP